VLEESASPVQGETSNLLPPWMFNGGARLPIWCHGSPITIIADREQYATDEWSLNAQRLPRT
jgi:hypothetical protein